MSFAIRYFPGPRLGYGKVVSRHGMHVLFQAYAGNEPQPGTLPEVVHWDDIIEGRFASPAKVILAIDESMRWFKALEAERGAEQSAEVLMTHLRRYERDDCEVCHGARGGVRGNENIVDGKVVCDYCTIDILDARKS
ncbi:hypothetical protein Ccr5_gp253 [Caulobacter phage Ccr5]|nr:hypothetical protein Ccr5_gp253 [Caulobacter phage Ccr5]